jgi:hypothetical protein
MGTLHEWQEAQVATSSSLLFKLRTDLDQASYRFGSSFAPIWIKLRTDLEGVAAFQLLPLAEVYLLYQGVV